MFYCAVKPHDIDITLKAASNIQQSNIKTVNDPTFLTVSHIQNDLFLLISYNTTDTFFILEETHTNLLGEQEPISFS